MVTVLKGDNWVGDQDGGDSDHLSYNIIMALVKVMMVVVVLCGSMSHSHRVGAGLQESTETLLWGWESTV